MLEHDTTGRMEGLEMDCEEGSVNPVPLFSVFALLLLGVPGSSSVWAAMTTDSLVAWTLVALFGTLAFTAAVLGLRSLRGTAEGTLEQEGEALVAREAA